MRLVVDAPAVIVAPLRLAPDEPREWLLAVAAASAMPGDASMNVLSTARLVGEPARRIHVDAVRSHATREGWPLLIVGVEVHAGGILIEQRAYALYACFERAAIAELRGATLDRDVVDAVFATGRPDWSGALEPVAHYWDLGALDPSEPGMPPPRDDAALLAELADLDVALATAPTAAAHDQRGVLLGQLDRYSEAIVAWEHALALAPGRADVLYNLAQARFLLDQLEPALAAFQATLAADPTDVMVLRKVAQCLYALDQFDTGEAVRAELRAAWAASANPQVRVVEGYVFDQFAGDGFGVHVTESLTAPRLHLTFQAVALDGGSEHPLPAAVLINARSPTELVVARRTRGPLGDQLQSLGTLRALPPHDELRREVARLLVDALVAT